MNKALPSLLRFAFLALPILIVGCTSSEEKANEDAIKSRDAQAAQMGGHGHPPSGAPGAGAPGTAAPGGSGTPNR